MRQQELIPWTHGFFWTLPGLHKNVVSWSNEKFSKVEALVIKQ